MSITFLLHPNRPRAAAVRASLAGTANLRLLPAVEYSDMVRLLTESWILLTDSGGLQEEGAALGKPVLVLRDVTERIESPENLEWSGPILTGLCRPLTIFL